MKSSLTAQPTVDSQLEKSFKSTFVSSLVLIALVIASRTGQAQAADKSEAQLETYKDLIQKAQNLTLQRDRLQTSQLLVRGIKREARASQAAKELMKALDELTTVFYTEKAQTAFVAGDSIIENKPKEAIEHFLTAQRLEDGNLATLRSLTRAYLILGEIRSASARRRRRPSSAARRR